MIRRGIVEQIVDRYTVKVRIPEIDQVSTAALHVNTEDLDEMTVCVLPGCCINMQVGDIVIVSYDPYSSKQAVVIGYLFRENMSSTLCDFELNKIDVKGKATLPYYTSIGNVTSEQLSYLSGTTDNIQRQLDDLKISIEKLENQIKKG